MKSRSGWLKQKKFTRPEMDAAYHKLYWSGPAESGRVRTSIIIIISSSSNKVRANISVTLYAPASLPSHSLLLAAKRWYCPW